MYKLHIRPISYVTGAGENLQQRRPRRRSTGRGRRAGRPRDAYGGVEVPSARGGAAPNHEGRCAGTGREQGGDGGNGRDGEGSKWAQNQLSGARQRAREGERVLL